MQSSPPPYYLIPVGSKFPSQHPILESPTSLPQCVWPSQTTGKITVLFILILFWTGDWKTKDSAPSGSKHFLTLICC
jgi:hypothetical protein